MAVYMISWQKSIAFPQTSSKQLENIVHVVNAIHKTIKISKVKKEKMNKRNNLRSKSCNIINLHIKC